jgi:hypothetical protein
MKKQLISLAMLMLMLAPLAAINAQTGLDVGLNEINNSIDLGSEDPRVIISKIINTTMLFLGIIAVVLVLVAGFKWMTAAGNEDQVSSAKKLLGQAIIGLVIVLASWGIAQFILSQLVTATNN